MKNLSLALVAGLTLIACSPSTQTTPATPAEPMAAAPTEPAPPVTPPADPAMADTCNMAQYAALIGKPATDPAVPAGSPTIRIIKPGDQITMDFNPARLNIEIGAAGNIAGVRCG